MNTRKQRTSRQFRFDSLEVRTAPAAVAGLAAAVEHVHRHGTGQEHAKGGHDDGALHHGVANADAGHHQRGRVDTTAGHGRGANSGHGLNRGQGHATPTNPNSGRGRGGQDDPAGHDQNDDNGQDPAGHDQNDDNGQDPAGHDQNDDNGQDPAGHDQNDDNGTDTGAGHKQKRKGR